MGIQGEMVIVGPQWGPLSVKGQFGEDPLDNLLQKKRNCFRFWKSNLNMALIMKKGYF